MRSRPPLGRSTARPKPKPAVEIERSVLSDRTLRNGDFYEMRPAGGSHDADAKTPRPPAIPAPILCLEHSSVIRVLVQSLIVRQLSVAVSCGPPP